MERCNPKAEVVSSNYAGFAAAMLQILESIGFDRAFQSTASMQPAKARGRGFVCMCLVGERLPHRASRCAVWTLFRWPCRLPLRSASAHLYALRPRRRTLRIAPPCTCSWYLFMRFSSSSDGISFRDIRSPSTRCQSYVASYVEKVSHVLRKRGFKMELYQHGTLRPGRHVIESVHACEMEHRTRR